MSRRGNRRNIMKVRMWSVVRLKKKSLNGCSEEDTGLCKIWRRQHGYLLKIKPLKNYIDPHYISNTSISISNTLMS